MSEDTTSKSNRGKYLIFSMNKGFYAIDTIAVKEIVSDMLVYTLPFVPNYVIGLLNRQGEPFTVVDPMILLGQEKQSSSTFILFKSSLFQDEGERFSVKITDVLDFCDVEEGGLQDLPDGKRSEFFSSEFLWNKKSVAVLNVLSLHSKLKQDFLNRYGGNV